MMSSHLHFLKAIASDSFGPQVCALPWSSPSNPEWWVPNYCTITGSTLTFSAMAQGDAPPMPPSYISDRNREAVFPIGGTFSTTSPTVFEILGTWPVTQSNTGTGYTSIETRILHDSAVRFKVVFKETYHYMASRTREIQIWTTTWDEGLSYYTWALTTLIPVSISETTYRVGFKVDRADPRGEITAYVNGQSYPGVFQGSALSGIVSADVLHYWANTSTTFSGTTFNTFGHAIYLRTHETVLTLPYTGQNKNLCGQDVEPYYNMVIQTNTFNAGETAIEYNRGIQFAGGTLSGTTSVSQHLVVGDEPDFMNVPQDLILAFKLECLSDYSFNGPVGSYISYIFAFRHPYDQGGPTYDTLTLEFRIHANGYTSLHTSYGTPSIGYTSNGYTFGYAAERTFAFTTSTASPSVAPIPDWPYMFPSDHPGYVADSVEMSLPTLLTIGVGVNKGLFNISQNANTCPVVRRQVVVNGSDFTFPTTRFTIQADYRSQTYGIPMTSKYDLGGHSVKLPITNP